MTHAQKDSKFKGQSVKKIEWNLKQMDRRTNGRTDATECFTFPTNATGKYKRYNKTVICSTFQYSEFTVFPPK